MNVLQAERLAELLTKRDKLDEAAAKAAGSYQRLLKDASSLLSRELAKLEIQMGAETIDGPSDADKILDVAEEGIETIASQLSQGRAHAAREKAIDLARVIRGARDRLSIGV